jgi:hypothetical protein
VIIPGDWFADLPAPEPAARLAFLNVLVEERGSDRRYRLRGEDAEPNLTVAVTDKPEEVLQRARAGGVPLDVIEVPKLADGTRVLFVHGRFEVKAEDVARLAYVEKVWRETLGAAALGARFSTRQPLRATQRNSLLLFRALDFLSALAGAVPGIEVRAEKSEAPLVVEAPGEPEPCARCGGTHPGDLCERVRDRVPVREMGSVGRTLKDDTRVAVSLVDRKLDLAGPRLEKLPPLVEAWRAAEERPWRM